MLKFKYALIHKFWFLAQGILSFIFIIGFCVIFARAQTEAVSMKKAVMVIAHRDFRDEELIETKEVLEKNGIEVKVSSTSLTSAKGVLGTEVIPDILLDEVRAEDFDAVIFVGGSGCEQSWEDSRAHRLAKEAFISNKVVGAICIAPVILAKAGLLKGKKATVFSSEVNLIEAEGAKYTAKSVEKDGNIITAAGPSAAEEFGKEITIAIKQNGSGI